jgi:hypothetical protein
MGGALKKKGGVLKKRVLDLKKGDGASKTGVGGQKRGASSGGRNEIGSSPSYHSNESSEWLRKLCESLYEDNGSANEASRAITGDAGKFSVTLNLV